MNKIITILTMIALTGCITNKPDISAPSYMKPIVHHLRNVVPDCFKSRGLSNGDYDCRLAVKTIPATGEYKGHPIYVHDGKTVGGITTSIGCRKPSAITMPVIGERYSAEALQHEICHAYDYCRPCRGGHPSEYSPCCPSWPYLKSLDASYEDIPIRCISSEIDGQVISITLIGDDTTILGVDDSWIKDLIKEIEKLENK